MRREFLVVMLVALIGCGEAPVATVADAGTNSDATPACGIAVNCTPSIRVLDGYGAVLNKAARVFNAEGVTGPMVIEFQVTNAGNFPLVFSSVSLDYIAPAAEDTPAFACVGPTDAACGITIWPDVAPTGTSGTTSVMVRIRYTPPADKLPRTATLHIASNDLSKPTPIPDFQINLKTAFGVPKIVTPPEADLGFVKVPATTMVTFQIKNQGTGDLIITDIDATALDDSFSLVIDGTEYPCAQVIHLATPIDLKPGDTKEVQIVYTAKDTIARIGDLILYTNDPSLTSEGGPGWKRIHVKVNAVGQCLKLIPSDVIFGGTKVGNVGTQKIVLKSCGDQTVDVTSIAFDAKGPGSFAIDYASIQETGGQAPSETAPLGIDKNSQATVSVKYQPTQVSAKAADGTPILDTAHIVVTVPNSEQQTIDVVVSGFAAQQP